MTPIKDQNETMPFASDADYIEALEKAVHARARLIGARVAARRAADKDAIGLALVGRDGDTTGKLDRLEAAELRLWSEIDERRSVTKAAGRVLGLDAICDEYGLDDTERLVLILTTLPAVGLEFAEVLGDVASYGFSICSATPEMVGVMGGLGIADRLRLREQLGPKGKLVAAGLVEVELPIGERVQDFPSASILILPRGFNRIAGLPGDDVPATCGACGQRMNLDRR